MSDTEEHICPWNDCDYSTTSRHGLKVHHTKTHNEQISATAWTEEISGVSPDALDDITELSRLLFEQNLHPREIGELTGYSRKHVTNKISEYGIELPFPCSSCDESFLSRQGVGQHHASQHGESLRDYEATLGDIACPECDHAFDSDKALESHYGLIHQAGVTKVCDWCGDEFTRPPAIAEKQRFCGVRCMGDWQISLPPEEHSRYQGGMMTDVCSVCDEEYDLWPYEVDNRSTCGDDACRYAHHSEWMVENHPTKNYVTVGCGYCGNAVEAPEWYADRHRQFCDDLDCRTQWRSEYFGGQNNPNWQGGHTLYEALITLFPIHWQDARNSARETADYTCQMCGSSEDELNEELDVHHLIPILSGGTNGNYNLCPLCDSCHRKAELYTRDLFEPLYVTWSDNELPEGRLPSREYLEDIVGIELSDKQTELSDFASG